MSTTPEKILKSGYAFIPGHQILMAANVGRGSFSALASAFELCSSDGESRRRLYDRNLILPTAKGKRPKLFYMSSDYWQSAEHNPEAGGKLRQFGGLSPEIRRNKLLLELVRFDFALLPFEKLWRNFKRNAIEVGIHFIRMQATENSSGMSTPNRPHRDGEFFTFVHLINRRGVIGGETQVYRCIQAGEELDRGPRLLTRTLLNPLDSIVVWDRNVFHDVTPVTLKSGYLDGARDVILIDFSPLEPVKLDARGEPVIDRGSFCLDVA